MFSIFRFSRLGTSSLLLALVAAATAYADPPVASTDLSSGEKVGVTLYQVNGLKGSIPLKKVYKVDPSGDTGHYELQFASNNMNTEMQIQAKYVIPAGMTFKSFEVRTVNGPTQVTTAGADSWDGQTIIDKVTVSPWNMNRVLQQCVAHLQNGDGTFKDSATFDLQADSTETIRGKGIATPPNAPPGSASVANGTMNPRTRVTAYIVSEDRKGSGADRNVKRVEPVRPVIQPTYSQRPSTQPVSGRVLTARAPQVRVPVVAPQPQPQRLPSANLTNSARPVPAKDRFERTKPHIMPPASSNARLPRR